MPSYSFVLPPFGRPARSSQFLISCSVAPSNTGVAKYRPSACAAPPRWVSRIWPTFIRDGTPSGLSTISTGVPSGRCGMSSSGRMRAMTPLLPWRPAILSPTDSLRFIATYTFTSFLTLGPLLEIPQIVLEARVVGRDLQPDHRLVGHVLEDVLGQDGALLHQPLAAVLVEQIRPQ